MAAMTDPEQTAEIARSLGLGTEKFEGHGKLLTKIFDHLVEP
jgi:lysyl-tRNA synthetase class 2